MMKIVIQPPRCLGKAWRIELGGTAIYRNTEVNIGNRFEKEEKT